MAVKIRVDQVTRPPGVPGQAREDLVLAQTITLTAVGGPFASYLWSFVHKPIDIAVPIQSAAILATPTSASTTCAPVDKAGTFNAQLLVDAGFGLGARQEDVARITFYAGPVLATDPAEFPRREPAFGERLEHNVPNAVFPAGNSIGWAYERLKKAAVLARMYSARSWASGRIHLTGAGATLVRGFNVGAPTRLGMGVVSVPFLVAMPDANYSITHGALGTAFVDGYTTAAGLLAATFTVRRFTTAGALVDDDFCFDVRLGA